MALFYYRYIDSHGRKKSARIDADNLTEAKEKLRLQKILVVSIHDEGAGKKKAFFSKSRDVMGKDHLITFTTQLSQLLIAGMPLYESLLSLEEQYRNEPFHHLIITLGEEIKRGNSLSNAMKRFPKTFNKLYCALIEAGESVGGLDISLERVSLLLSKERKLKKQLVTALIYPILLFSFSILVSLLLLTFVVPSLGILFEDRHVNRFTSLVMGISHFLTAYWHYYMPLLMGSCLLIFFYFKKEQGKTFLQRQILHLPFLKTLIIQTAMARFCRTMGTLLQGGVSIIRALQIARLVMHNPFLEKIVEEAEKKIIEGSLLSRELQKSPLIPSLVPRMLAIGEEGGSAPTMFNKIADLYEDEVEKNLTRVTALAQPVILVVMGAIVGMIMLAVLLPLTDINAFL